MAFFGMTSESRAQDADLDHDNDFYQEAAPASPNAQASIDAYQTRTHHRIH